MTFPKVSPLLGPFLLLLAMSPHIILSKPHGETFKFLQHLEGCHKGQSVKGIHNLKLYLEKFGYLSYPKSNKSLTSHANDEEFDDRLESAVKTYQLNYHLKVTGSIDSQTVKQMMMPRCGVPDIINGTTWMRSGKKKHHHHGPSSLHIVSHFSFFPRRQKWPVARTNLTYRFQSSVQVVGTQDLKTICAQAFARWANVSHFRFQEAGDGTKADMVIGFHSGDHGDGARFDGRGGTLAHAFAPTDGRFHYDADERWSSNPVAGVMDLESVAVHEIGHLLGLGHSSVRDAIMYPSIESGTKKRDLHEDDILGIRTLYGLGK